MLSMGLIAIGVVVVPIGFAVRYVVRKDRRKKMMKEPPDPSWIPIIERNVAIFKYLPEKYRDELYGHMHNFLREKNFEGAGGLVMTDEIKVTIAAQACILILNKEYSNYFPRCDSVVVYPSAYVADNKVDMGSHVIAQKSARLGESWTRGVVVLAWDHVQQRALDISGGHNVVLHEFAHQLDQEDGRGDGAPILEKRSSYASWARIFSNEYEHLQAKAKKGVRDVMDFYGATNPAEFFAVATETFFEKGPALKKKHPELYEELKEYYKLDPAAWENNAQQAP